MTDESYDVGTHVEQPINGDEETGIFRVRASWQMKCWPFDSRIERHSVAGRQEYGDERETPELGRRDALHDSRGAVPLWGIKEGRGLRDADYGAPSASEDHRVRDT